MRDGHSDAFSLRNGADLLVEEFVAVGNLGHGFDPGIRWLGAEFSRIRSEGNAEDGVHDRCHNGLANVRDSTTVGDDGRG